MDTVVLDGSALTLEQLEAVARRGVRVALAEPRELATESRPGCPPAR